MIQNNIKDVTIAQANVLTQSRENLTVVEKRALYIIIREVRSQFIDRKDGQKNIFDNLIVRMDTEDLTKAEMKLSEAYKSLVNLRKKTFFIEDSECALGIGYINYFEHKKRDTKLEVEVSKKMLPFLVDLAEHFTTYNLIVALSLKTKYTQRFYELCSQFEHSDPDPNHKNSGYFFSTLDKLRWMLMLEDKYPRYALIKKYVLDTAQKELKKLYDDDKCNLYFEYKEEKAGRSILKIHFFIYSKESKKQVVVATDKLTQMHYIRTWLRSWLNAEKRPKNKKWIGEVISHLELNSDLIPKLYKRFVKLMKDEPHQNHAAIARHIIEEDFLP